MNNTKTSKKSKNQKSPAERVVSMRAKLITQMPFFACLAMSMDMVEDNSIDTLATDAKNIYYSPAFVETLSDGELAYITLHEVMHAALGHIWRKASRDHELWNIATDYVVNAYLDEVAKTSKLLESPKIGLHDAQYSKDCAEDVYKKLQQQQQQQQQQPGMQAPTNHGMWDKAQQMSTEQQQLAQTQWDARMVTAAQAATKDFGNLPAGLQRAINELTKSKVDWRVALADFLIEEVNDYGFTPPDLRIDEVEFGTYLPSFSETDTTCKDLQIYVDTSGSMSEDDIAKILSEIQGIIEQFKSVTGFVNIFNASVLDQRFELENINFKNMPEIEGGGGTSFQACADHLAKMVAGGQEVSAVIMLTDGYADIPDEKDWMAPVVWLLTEDSMAKSITYGKVITINN